MIKRKKPTFVSFLPPFLEREKRFELSTSTLARWHSTAELLPRKGAAFTIREGVCQGWDGISDNFGRPVGPNGRSWPERERTGRRLTIGLISVGEHARRSWLGGRAAEKSDQWSEEGREAARIRGRAFRLGQPQTKDLLLVLPSRLPAFLLIRLVRARGGVSRRRRRSRRCRFRDRIRSRRRVGRS